jgi:hypothetical protein
LDNKINKKIKFETGGPMDLKKTRALNNENVAWALSRRALSCSGTQSQGTQSLGHSVAGHSVAAPLYWFGYFQAQPQFQLKLG